MGGLEEIVATLSRLDVIWIYAAVFGIAYIENIFPPFPSDVIVVFAGSLVAIGTGEKEVKIGNETQPYRHEEKFHRPTAVAVRISDTLEEDAIAAKAEQVGRLTFERVGTEIRVNLVAVDNDSGDAARFGFEPGSEVRCWIEFATDAGLAQGVIVVEAPGAAGPC